jgi:hypothetical protein
MRRTIRLLLSVFLILNFHTVIATAGNLDPNPSHLQSAIAVPALKILSDATPGQEVWVDVLEDPITARSIGLQYRSSAETKQYTLQDLPQGIVLMEKSGKKIVTLKSATFDPATGGAMEIIYLNDGISNTYRSFKFEVDRSGSQWLVYSNTSAGRLLMNHAFVKTKRFLGQIIGIDKIIPNGP